MDRKGSSLRRQTWERQFDRLLKRDWCIDTIDAGLSDEELKRHWKDGQAPAEFVEWFAEKYDLIPARDSDYLPGRSGAGLRTTPAKTRRGA